MSDQIMEIAARMRELREICDYTVEGLAAELEVSPEEYLQYESGEKDIPISFILAMSSKCHVEPAALLAGEEPKLHEFSVTRAGHGKGVERRKEYRYQSLAYNFGNKIAEPFFVTAGAVPAGTPLVLNTHKGQEFDYVLEGTLRMQVNGKEVLLQPGDSIYFDSSYPHGMQATGGLPAKFLAVVL